VYCKLEHPAVNIWSHLVQRYSISDCSLQLYLGG